MTKLVKLFQPIKIGTLELPNRIIMPAVTTNYDNEDSDRQANYFAERAKGGVGLIITGSLQGLYPGRRGRSSPPRMNLNDDSDIPRLRKLTNAVHDSGGRFAAQLVAYGYWAKNGRSSTPEDVGPSAVELPKEGLHPSVATADFLPRVRALTVEEIRLIENQLGDAAVRAREAGFDAIELQVVGGNLLHRFTNSFTNQRKDEYGGSLRNRTRIIVETLANIRKKAGNDFPIICRIPGEDMVPWGLSLDDWNKIVPILEKAGVDALNIYPGWHESRVPRYQTSVPRGAFIHLAEGIKRVAHVPVAAGNRINDPVLAEQFLAEGRADLIAMGRPLVADPYLPSKAKEGRLDDIRLCTGCCVCYEDGARSVPITCSVNAQLGKEVEYVIKPAEKPKRVLVIGGGPGGMEAARVAALRGHKVTLFEKTDKLGGQLRVGTIPPYKDEWNTTINYQTTQLRKLNVEVRLNEEATVSKVVAGKPDAVIVATGAVHSLPNIPGVNGRNVATAVEMLTGTKETGRDVVVIGGGSIGCETAEFLHQKGKKVTVLEMLPRIAADVGSHHNRWNLIDRMHAEGIRMETGTKADKITEKGVWVSRQGSLAEFFEADTVVIATGMSPLNTLVRELEGKVTALFPVGDCAKIGQVVGAIESGFCAGLSV